MPQTVFRCRAILFDLDGTLIDSLAAVDRAWTRWSLHYGLDPAAILNGIHGRRVADSLQDLAPHLDPIQAADFLFQIESTDTEGIVLLPGSIEFLSVLPSEAWTIVTSGAAEVAKARLRATGIPIPPRAVYAEDIVEGKPSPMPFLLGARILGVAPEQCVVFEDTVAGVQGAHAAGMRAVAIGQTAAEAADAWVTNLSDVSADIDANGIELRIDRKSS